MSSAGDDPLERQFGQMPSLAQMTSVSSFATSQITLQFNLDRSIDAGKTCKPRSMRRQPVAAHAAGAAHLQQSNPADTPVLTLAVSGPHLPLPQVRLCRFDLGAENFAGQRRWSGDAQRQPKPAVRVQVDPSALAGSGLSLEDIWTTIVAANVNQPKGKLGWEQAGLRDSNQ